MKVHVEIDMTPEEARRLMGLPDVAKMQEDMLKEMQKRMKAALDTSLDGFGGASLPTSHPGPSRTPATSCRPLRAQHPASERSSCPAAVRA